MFFRHAMTSSGLLLSLGAMLALLAACTPSLNWREVRLGGAAVQALLPCKPEHAVRSVALGQGRQADLALWSCDADGATFAVSHMGAPEAAQADAVLQQWRAAVLARLQVPDADAASAVAAAVPFVPAGALALPSSVRLQVSGRRADGRSVTADAVWFARLEGGSVRLYHAVVYGPGANPDVAGTFFGGLRAR